MNYATNVSENIPHFQDLEAAAAAEEAEEALSLSGLILKSDDSQSITDHDYSVRHSFPEGRSRSSSEPSDFFEFFSDSTISSSEMSHAEDIIFCGKLIPSYKVEQPQTNPYLRKHQTTTEEKDDKLQSFHRRRSESMSELNFSTINRSNSTKSSNNIMMMRNSRSLDYQKLYGKSSRKMEIERSLSAKSSGSKTEVSLKEKVQSPRPRYWYFLTFGLVKLPAEMALQDIKNRQVRRNPGSLFSSFHAGEKDLTKRYDRRSSWDDLLKVLSCKDDASDAVTTSFGCLQHV